MSPLYVHASRGYNEAGMKHTLERNAAMSSIQPILLALGGIIIFSLSYIIGFFANATPAAILGL